MNNRVLNVLIVVMLIGSIQGSKLAMDRLEQVKNNDFKLNPFGQSVIETIQLQLHTNGPTDKIINLLQGLIQDLSEQQTASDNDHQTKNEDWDNQIKDLTATIKKLTGIIDGLEEQINNKESEIKSKKRDIKINKAQLAINSQKQEKLSAAHAADVNATTKRTDRQSKVLEAVKYLISELEKANESQSFIQFNQIKQQLQNLVREHPIDALVQLTMTFDKNAVNFAIKKLAEIRDSVAASLVDEAEKSEIAQRNYLSLLGELVEFAKTTKADLATNEGQLTVLKGELVKLNESLKSNKELKQTNIDNRAATQLAQKKYNEQYESDKKQRASEVSAIKSVVEIFKANKSDIDAADANNHSNQ